MKDFEKVCEKVINYFLENEYQGKIQRIFEDDNKWYFIGVHKDYEKGMIDFANSPASVDKKSGEIKNEFPSDVYGIVDKLKEVKIPVKYT